MVYTLGMSRTALEMQRYHRQVLLPGVGEAGQRRLTSGCALVVGVGALGCAASEMLVRAGVGRVVLVDRDVVELTNLQRQCLFAEPDVGEPKAVAAQHRLAAINGGVRVEAFVEDFDHRSAARLAAGADVLVDGTDNFHTRFVMDDFAASEGRVYVYGGAVGTLGSSMAILPATARGDTAWERAGVSTPTLRDLFSGDGVGGGEGNGSRLDVGGGPTCDTAGVLGPLVQVVAAFEATEAMKALLGRWEAFDGKLLQVDPWSNVVRRVRPILATADGTATRPAARRYGYLTGEHASEAVSLCGRDAVQLAAVEGGGFDLHVLAERLKAAGEVRASAFMVRFRPGGSGAAADGNHTTGGGVEVSAFPDGRVIVRGTTDVDEARTLCRRYLGV